MEINRLNNHYHSTDRPSIKTKNGEWWFMNGLLHRSRKPAVICKHTIQYYWRGIRLTEDMAMGTIPTLGILKIPNIEQRQASMEIVGYEKFFKFSKLLDSFTPDSFLDKFPVDENPMYQLFEIKTGLNEENEAIKILVMCDPSDYPVVKYPIRVSPAESNCKDAVAHSYKMEWGEFEKNKNWV